MRSAAEPAREPTKRPTDDRAVGALELFFDLVFVYSMSQVTHLIEEHPSWTGFGHGVLALVAVWWAWVCYTWLTNTSAESGTPARALIFLAMSAMLVASSSLVEAFGDEAMTFALALLTVRLLHVVLLIYSARGDTRWRRALLRLLPVLLIGPGLVVLAATQSSPLREVLWLGAVLVDFGGPALFGMGGFHVRPGHFVERHGLMVIIALGESIYQMGRAATGDVRSADVLAAVVFGVLVSAAMWWAYFGLKHGAAARLRRAPAPERGRLARDAYSYLHLPLVGGIIWYSLGVGEAIAHPGEPLQPLSGLALCGGAALFYAGEVLYRWRDHHELATDRLVTSAVLIALIPVAPAAPALTILAVVTAVSVAFVAWEVWRRPEIGGARPQPD
ncbi:low temperature requirement protein A [Actinoplanes subglobosus]|uniref:Low temperature requirement protein A n=1 Tax=Actinoplanes subglobosus TaxID=1547892 RepID=A0ABV8J639_9ACTN